MSLNENVRHSSGGRVLVDTTQTPMAPQYRGRSMYLARLRESHDDMLGSGQASKDWCSNTQIHTLGQEEALARVSASRSPMYRERPKSPPVRLYRPKDQLSPEHHSLFVVVDRQTDVVLARVRGSLEWVGREARKLVAAYGARMADVRIVLETEQ